MPAKSAVAAINHRQFALATKYRDTTRVNSERIKAVWHTSPVR